MAVYPEPPDRYRRADVPAPLPSGALRQVSGRRLWAGGIATAVVGVKAVVPGATPLFFLDYFACGKLDPEATASIVAGDGGVPKSSLTAYVSSPARTRQMRPSAPRGPIVTTAFAGRPSTAGSSTSAYPPRALRSRVVSCSCSARLRWDTAARAKANEPSNSA